MRRVRTASGTYEVSEEVADQIQADYADFVAKGSPAGGQYAVAENAGVLIISFATLSTLSIDPAGWKTADLAEHAPSLY